MKQYLLLLSMSIISLNTLAQQENQHEHSGDRFSVSVFAQNHTILPQKRADIGVYEKLAAQFPNWYIQTDQWTGGFYDLNGPAIAVSGSTLEAKAKAVLQNQLAFLDIKPSEWMLKDTYTDNDGYSYLYFTQKIDGKAVIFSKMNFRFTPDAALTRIQMKSFGEADKSLVPVISESKVLEIANTEMGDAIVSKQMVEPDLHWFPIPSTKGYTLHPAYKFWIEGKLQESSSIPLNIYGFVDAISGELLYRNNETKDAVDLKVVGSIYTNGILNPTSVVGLPGVTGKVGTAVTLLANDTGLIRSSTLFAPTTMSVSLQGQWSTVKSVPDANATPAFSRIITSSTGSIDSFKASSLSSSRHINAYYHVNTVHDFMKKQYGATFTSMDYSLTTNVDATGSCNAFYTAASGTSINFFPAGGGCPSYAELRDVVYHEYGHAISSRMYGGMDNGGLNEGQADVWAMSITRDSIMARGSRFTASSFIRRYDIEPKVYPFDLTGQVHANGEIIAGAWWDYGKNVNSVDSMSKLFSKALITGKPDGPEGTEGKVYFDFLMDALISDDIDMDLSNGTPNFPSIVAAFAKHGIYLLQDVGITHTELNHQSAGTPINVNARLAISNPSFFQSFSLVYRNSRAIGTVWTTVPMVDAGGYNFNATIPAQAEGTIIDYYFVAKDLLNYEGVFFPTFYYPISVIAENRSNISYQFGVGISAMKRVNFESPLSSDWTVGQSTDNATAGKWVVAVPVATYSGGAICQTGNDHTTGTGNCLVTANAFSSNAYTQSVRNGKTTVLSPLFDLSEYTNPIVEYYRWFANDRQKNNYKKEYWRVQMGSGSIFFLRDIDYTSQSDYTWRRKMFKPKDLFTDATKVQLLFTATETPVISGTTSVNGLVEAAVDDIVIYEGKAGVSSISNKNIELATIFPNPAVERLNIILPTANFQTVSIRFYDLGGKLVSTVATQKGATHYAIETKEIVPGQYMLVLEMDKTIQTHKITVQGK